MSIVREFEAAFNRADVEALVACFTPAGRYVDNFYRESFRDYLLDTG